ncbi:nucleotidyltransferase domain-containing protein [Desulfonatronovibrio magnus]|uniref:nucleotidyltransferase domain-containing protein n=1 Tax=Desulfonatronovibrio magnus TaxID=698827 RepID=UPI000697B9A9|nr:nucleotidyltransferase domain-containing protein [Desulfonatronovibrio magnus]
MSSAKDISVKKALLFLDLLREAEIDVAEAYLFGSAVSGVPHSDSDIDLAVVSKRFQGIRYHDMKMISGHRRKIDLRLEIHPLYTLFPKMRCSRILCSFFLKIKQDGLRIHP